MYVYLVSLPLSICAYLTLSFSNRGSTLSSCVIQPMRTYFQGLILIYFSNIQNTSAYFLCSSELGRTATDRATVRKYPELPSGWKNKSPYFAIVSTAMCCINYLLYQPLVYNSSAHLAIISYNQFLWQALKK